MARANGGGAKRQIRHTPAHSGRDAVRDSSTESPQRIHAGPIWPETSDQHASHIGAEENCGRGEAQREQDAGKRMQLTASMGLRSTRTTARHLEIPDSGTPSADKLGSLRKTHLAPKAVAKLPHNLSIAVLSETSNSNYIRRGWAAHERYA